MPVIQLGTGGGKMTETSLRLHESQVQEKARLREDMMNFLQNDMKMKSEERMLASRQAHEGQIEMLRLAQNQNMETNRLAQAHEQFTKSLESEEARFLMDRFMQVDRDTTQRAQWEASHELQSRAESFHEAATGADMAAKYGLSYDPDKKAFVPLKVEDEFPFPTGGLESEKVDISKMTAEGNLIRAGAAAGKNAGMTPYQAAKLDVDRQRIRQGDIKSLETGMGNVNRQRETALANLDDLRAMAADPVKMVDPEFKSYVEGRIAQTSKGLQSLDTQAMAMADAKSALETDCADIISSMRGATNDKLEKALQAIAADQAAAARGDATAQRKMRGYDQYGGSQRLIRLINTMLQNRKLAEGGAYLGTGSAGSQE